MVIELENIGEKINDEDQTIILLNSLPSTYSQLRDTIKYGRDTLSLDYLELAIRSKELELRAEKKANSNNEAVNVQGRMEKRDNKNKRKSRSKSQRTFRCYHCNKEGHIKRECPNRKKKSNDKYESGDASVVLDGYDSVEVLVHSAQDTH